MFSVGDYKLNRDQLFLMAGPCVLEESNIGYEIAAATKKIAQELQIPFIFKASYLKANRSSKDGFRGIGVEKGLEQLRCIKEELHLPIMTDVHDLSEVERVAKVVDIMQIPAFLCRQTYLIEAVAKTGRAVNIKKGQFMAPWDMKYAVEKVQAMGNHRIFLTERGSTFGYNNLVVDIRSIPVMSQYDCLVVFDGTHSAQLPGAGKGETSGQREMVPFLVKSAVAAGCHGIFLEVHPNPETSPSDKANIYPLDGLAALLKTALAIHKVVH